MDRTAISEYSLEMDIGGMNLACARGLPGTEEIDLAQCNRLLREDWPEYVAELTRRHWPSFKRNRSQYWNSPAKFRMLIMFTALQRDLGVTYDKSCLEDPIDYTDAAPWFICGPMTGRGGTCVSLPFLFAAVGRRLGYPLFFVRAKEHLFLRWEKKGERFDIECTSQGFRNLPKGYYRTRPRQLSKEELATGYFLRKLSPREEVAECLLQRGHCLLDHLRVNEAIRTYDKARRICPGDPFAELACSVSVAIAAYLDYERAGADFDERVPESAQTPPFVIARRELARIRGLHARRHPEPDFDSMFTTCFAAPGH